MEDKAHRSAGTHTGMTPRQDDFVYRDQKGRYPWWVRSVDRITTEVDESIEARLNEDSAERFAANKMNTRRGKHDRR
jgi:hypothetical protein